MIGLPNAPFRVLEGELEKEYRSFRSREETQSLLVVGVVGSVVALAFVDADFRLVESRALAQLLLVGRLLLVGLIGATYVACRGLDDHGVRDRLVAVCAFAAVLLDLSASASRPPGFTGNVAISPVLVLVLYVAVPGARRTLTAAALLDSAGAIAVTIQNQAGFATLFSLVGALAFANWMGLVAMVRTNRWGREQFLAFRSLEQTNESLEKALAEVRTLRAIVPICASCKSIRDDEGYWERVEDYLSRSLGGAVSHGICPDCYERLYGDEYGDDAG